MALLEIEDLSVEFATGGGPFRAVDGVSLSIGEGEVLAIVGESGSGKSVSMLAVMGLLPWTAKVTAKRMQFDGRDLLNLAPRARRKLIGKDIAMIFQEPTTSLNPCFTSQKPYAPIWEWGAVRRASVPLKSCVKLAFQPPKSASPVSRISFPAA